MRKRNILSRPFTRILTHKMDKKLVAVYLRTKISFCHKVLALTSRKRKTERSIVDVCHHDLFSRYSNLMHSKTEITFVFSYTRCPETPKISEFREYRFAWMSLITSDRSDRLSIFLNDFLFLLSLILATKEDIDRRVSRAINDMIRMILTTTRVPAIISHPCLSICKVGTTL